MRIMRSEGNALVRVVEEPEPVPGPGEVLIRTAASALCGSKRACRQLCMANDGVPSLILPCSPLQRLGPSGRRSAPVAGA